MKKNTLICLFCFGWLFFSLVACEKSNPIGAVPVTPEMLASVSQSLAEQTATEVEFVLNSTDETVLTEDAINENNVSEAPLQSVPETLPSEETPAASSVSENITQAVSVVYWTEGGTVYHLRDTCSTLKRSKEIFHGSIEDAILAQKERACKTCS